jgi:hypothetical protein
MHNPQFGCNFDAKAGGINWSNITSAIGPSAIAEIAKSVPANFFCRIEMPAELVDSLRARISVEYCTNLLWLYCWKRTLEPVPFVWIPRKPAGYWIKGNLL